MLWTGYSVMLEYRVMDWADVQQEKPRAPACY